MYMTVLVSCIMQLPVTLSNLLTLYYSGSGLNWGCVCSTWIRAAGYTKASFVIDCLLEVQNVHDMYNVHDTVYMYVHVYVSRDRS